MKKLVSFIAFASTAIAAASALAAPTAELKVKGVIKPAACVPAFSGNGIVDYGAIPASSLPRGQNLVLPTKTVDLIISCDNPMRIAIRTADNRATSNPSGLSGYLNAAANQSFGLGMVGNKPVGTFAVTMPSTLSQGDGQNVSIIFGGSSASSGWTTSTNRAFMSTDGTLHAWAVKNNLSVGAFKTITAPMEIRTVLQKPEELPLQQDIPLDGAITFEIVYL